MKKSNDLYALLKQAFHVAKKEQYITVSAAIEYGGMMNGITALAPKLSSRASMKNGTAIMNAAQINK